MQAQPGTQPRHLRNHRSQSLRLKYAQKKLACQISLAHDVGRMFETCGK